MGLQKGGRPREEKRIKGSIELAIEKKKKETTKDKKKTKVPIEPDDQVEYRATKRKKKMEKGAKKKQQGTIRGESDNDDNMMITELAKSKSKSGKELSVGNVAKGEKMKATKTTLTKKGGKKTTGSDSPKKRSASSPKKMSASSPKMKTSRKAGSKK